MGTLLLGYDVEYLADPQLSLKAVKVLAQIHKKHKAPATFFILGKLIESRGPEFREILDDDLFDVQSHTYSHGLLKDNKIHGKRRSLEAVKLEIEKATEIIESTFGRDILGLRAPCGHYKGLQGEREVLKIIWDNGIRFISSDSRGYHDTLPAPFNQPYWYEADDFSGLLEIPVQDWHDCCLKGYVRDAIGWPLELPWPIPPKPPETPEEEFAVYKNSLDYAIGHDLVFCPAFHPWSIYRFDPEARTIELILNYAEKKNMRVMTYLDIYKKLKSVVYSFSRAKLYTQNFM